MKTKLLLTQKEASALYSWYKLVKAASEQLFYAAKRSENRDAIDRWQDAVTIEDRIHRRWYKAQWRILHLQGHPDFPTPNKARNPKRK